MQFHWQLKTCLFLAVVWVSGCAGGESLVPVKGKVSNASEPLSTGHVTFFPESSKGNTSKKEAKGIVGADGTYVIYTGQSEGAAVGWYKVTVFAEKPRSTEGAEAYAPAEFLIDEKYTARETTPLLVEVKPDAPADHYNLKLDPRP